MEIIIARTSCVSMRIQVKIAYILSTVPDRVGTQWYYQFYIIILLTDYTKRELDQNLPIHEVQYSLENKFPKYITCLDFPS